MKKLIQKIKDLKKLWDKCREFMDGEAIKISKLESVRDGVDNIIKEAKDADKEHDGVVSRKELLEKVMEMI